MRAVTVSQDVPMSPAVPSQAALTQVVLDVERHVAAAGWDQTPRIYGVVATAELVEHEPLLAAELGLEPESAALTPLDQGELPWHGSLEASLARLAWPDAVLGAVLVIERVVAQEAGAERRMTTTAAGEGTDELRLVVGVLRDGGRMCAVRFRSADEETSVLSGADIAPALAEQLASTFAD
jgi:hypothetical protein